MPDDSQDRHELADGIGRRVVEQRRVLGLDQATTAALAGVSERFLRSVEHGKSTVQLAQLVRVLDVLGLELTVQTRRLPGARSPASEGGT